MKVPIGRWFNLREGGGEFGLSVILKLLISNFLFTKIRCGGELFQNMNTRVPSEPSYNLRKRSHPQQQQDTILLLIHQFEKLTIL